MDSPAPATKELPGTLAASRPPDAARNCLRSIDELMGDPSWGTKSLARDVMRVTSGNAPQTDTTARSALYDVMKRKQALKIDFLEGFLVRGSQGPFFRKLKSSSGA